MLWNAAEDYSSRKRMQRRNEQENKKGKEKLRIGIVSKSPWLHSQKTIFL